MAGNSQPTDPITSAALAWDPLVVVHESDVLAISPPYEGWTEVPTSNPDEWDVLVASEGLEIYDPGPESAMQTLKLRPLK